MKWPQISLGPKNLAPARIEQNHCRDVPDVHRPAPVRRGNFLPVGRGDRLAWNDAQPHDVELRQLLAHFMSLEDDGVQLLALRALRRLENHGEGLAAWASAQVVESLRIDNR